MALPGFTAEAAVGRTPSSYVSFSLHDQGALRGVQLAAARFGRAAPSPRAATLQPFICSASTCWCWGDFDCTDLFSTGLCSGDAGCTTEGGRTWCQCTRR